jgi:DHA2 family multidrug resistance protein
MLMSKVKPRILLACGIVIASFSFYDFAHLNLNVGYWDFFWPLIIQGSAMGLLFIPLTTITNDPVPNAEMGNATSLFNLMRNIGASVGIASVTTIVARHTQVHTNILGAHVNSMNPQARQMIMAMQQHFIQNGSDAVTALKQAYAAVFGMVQREAAIMSFNDAFSYLMLLFLAMLPLILLMRAPRKRGGGMAAH